MIMLEDYPYRSPIPIANACSLRARFYVDALNSRNNSHAFWAYIHWLQEKPRDNPYERLMLAAAKGDMPALFEYGRACQITQYPILHDCVQCLLPMEKLHNTPSDKLALFFLAPSLTITKELDTILAQRYLSLYPRFAGMLLTAAYMQRAPVDWECILRGDIRQDIACLALGLDKTRAIDILTGLFKKSPAFSTLLIWLIIDPSSALPHILAWHNKEEICRALCLHGDPQILAEHAGIFVSSPLHQVIEPLTMMLDEHADSRKILSEAPHTYEDALDPIRLRERIAEHFNGNHSYLFGQKRTPENIKHLIKSCTGTSVDYFRLFARYHGYC